MDSLFAVYGHVDVVAIRYHGDHPWEFDPFYNANPVEINQRFDYYSITTIPTMVIDGETIQRACFVEIPRDAIEERLAIASPIKLSASHTLGGDSCFVDIQVIAELEPPADTLSLRAAVIEDSISYQCPNGQDILNCVFRDFLPDPDGTGFEIAEGETLDFEFAFEIDPSWDVANISTVVFIQNDTDTSVVQAASSKPRPPAWARYDVPQRGKVEFSGGDADFPGTLVNRGAEADTFDIDFSAQLLSDWTAAYEILGGTVLPGAVALESDSSCVLNIAISCGYEPGTSEVTMTLRSRRDTSFSRSLRCFAVAGMCVLIIDDDGGYDLERYYEEACDSVGVVWGVWDREIAKPTLSDLDMSEAVIWFTGEEVPTLEVSDQEVLASYLDGGGNLLMTGQDIGYRLCYPMSYEHSEEAQAFYEDYLHATWVMPNANLFELSGRDGDPISDGIFVTIEGGDGANNQNFPDVIDSIAPARIIFDYSDPWKHGGVRFDSDSTKVAYLSFGFEGISTQADRSLLLSRVVSWFGVPASVTTFVPHLVISCYPNPATTYATIALSQSPRDARFEIYDVLGRIVRKDRVPETGTFVWNLENSDGRRLSAGVYFVSISAGPGTVRKKIVLAQ